MSEFNENVSTASEFELGEHEFYVERVLDHRWAKDKKLWYFLKWRDYPEAENSWVEKINAPDLVKEYWERIGGTPDPPFTQSSTSKASSSVPKASSSASKASSSVPKASSSVPKASSSVPKASSSVPKASSSASKASSSVPKASSSASKASSSVPKASSDASTSLLPSPNKEQEQHTDKISTAEGTTRKPVHVRINWVTVHQSIHQMGHQPGHQPGHTTEHPSEEANNLLPNRILIYHETRVRRCSPTELEQVKQARRFR